MKLEPKFKSREKILLFGWGKVGKSTAILSLAERNVDDQFYVIDTEHKWDYTLERNTASELGNVHVTQVEQDDWVAFTRALEEIGKVVKPDDWLVIDSITESWTALINFIAQKKYGKETREDFWDQFFTDNPKGNMQKDAQLDLPYQQVINPQYYKFYGVLKKWPSHVLATAQIDVLDDRDREGVRKAFGAVGVKPKGQKDLFFAFHEVLLLEMDRNNVHRMSSFGTSSDVNFREVEFSKDWAKDYLMLKAGWKPVK